MEVLGVERWSIGVESDAVESWRVMVGQSEPKRLGFHFSARRLTNGASFTAPHWFFALTVGLVAVALKPKPRYRFSLLDFLALTTFVASLAGLVAWLVRLRG
jgi:hypothetical protein